MNLPIILITLTITIPLIIASSPPTIYDALNSNGLPIGLLPNGITNFTINSTTGQFNVQMEKSCDTKFESQVRYNYNFSGVISYGQIANLSGITAQDLFLWFPVKGIRVDIPSSGLITFDVGVVSKRFSLSLFETPRDCTVSTGDLSGDEFVRLDESSDVGIVEDKTGKIVNNLSQALGGIADA